MYKVEKVWNHKRNVCVVIMSSKGYRCGYVGIPPEHPLYGKDSRSRPQSIQHLKEKVLNSPVGKKGIMDILFFFDSKEGIRIVDLFDVHGSLTYSGGSSTYPVSLWLEYYWPSRSNAVFYYNFWWFGYDCGHDGDGKDLSVVSPAVREIEERYPTRGIIRSVNYCISECEFLSSQLEGLYDLLST